MSKETKQIEKSGEIMLKETIICVIIVALIVFGNYKLQDYTDETVSEITGELSKIREDLLEDGILKNAEKIDNEKLKTDIEEIHNRWTDRNERLSYYIEHNELEKIDSAIVSLKSSSESGNYEDSVDQLEKTEFMLKNIQEKYALNLKNIF